MKHRVSKNSRQFVLISQLLIQYFVGLAEYIAANYSRERVSCGVSKYGIVFRVSVIFGLALTSGGFRISVRTIHKLI